MANGFYVEGASLYGNTDKTVGPTLPLGVNGGVVVGADADTVLTTSSGRRLLITPTANRNYTLPTGALELLGDTWTFVNLSSSFSVILKASDASTITTVGPGKTVQIFAKQDNPTTSTHWVNTGGFPAASQIVVNTDNGYGSTNTHVPLLANLESSVGTSITYTASATLGSRFTIAVDGLYIVTASISDGVSAASSLAITKNSSDGTINADLLPAAEILTICSATAVGKLQSMTGFGVLSAGDVIALQTYANAYNGYGSNTKFSIMRVG